MEPINPVDSPPRPPPIGIDQIGIPVQYFARQGARPQAAIVADVNADGTINLTVSSHGGAPYGVTNVRHYYEVAERPEVLPYWNVLP